MREDRGEGGREKTKEAEKGGEMFVPTTNISGGSFYSLRHNRTPPHSDITKTGTITTTDDRPQKPSTKESTKWNTYSSHGTSTLPVTSPLTSVSTHCACIVQVPHLPL